MGERKNCEIVQDLLPSYVEKLTNEETNNYVEEHLKECIECKKILDNMEKELNTNNDKRDKKAVKYLKKYKNKLRILTVIILIIFVVFIINTTRKVIIISSLSNKAKNTINVTNYRKVTYSYDKDHLSKTEMFNNGNKKKIVMTQINESGTKKITMYATKIENDEEGKYNVNIYTVTENTKTAKLNKNMLIYTDPQNMFEIENTINLIISSMFSNIKKTTYAGEECYYISNFNSAYSVSDRGMYVNSRTGMLISAIAYETEYTDSGLGRWPATEEEYEFGKVTDKDFIEPDINEYELE